jgi:hypothetical protein
MLFKAQNIISLPAASLRPELARIVAEIYLDCGDWELTKIKVLGDNALQSRSASSASRNEIELRKRLQTLTRQQMEILSTAPADSRSAIAWLAACKHSSFVFDFAADVLRSKIENMDPVLRPSDYEGFITSQRAAHPKVASLSSTTQVKLRGVLRNMLRDVGILGPDLKDDTILRPILPPEVQDAILADDGRWLAVFLVTDGEISALRK